VIIARTPFRVSLAGGGSDFPAYHRQRQGHVVTMAINHYMYVTVHRRFDAGLRVSYTKTELVDRLDDVQHDLVRESLRMVGVPCGIEVTTIADLPAGIGLGSSSSLTVGLLNALFAMKGEWHAPSDLARRACEVEIDIVGHPIGKQDQYIAAHGGLCELEFFEDTVTARPLVCPRETREALVDQLMLFFTGVSRPARSVLQEVRDRLEARSESPVDGLVALAGDMRRAILSGDLDAVGPILDTSWALKKRMASNVSNGVLDDLYARAREAGATGGKVAGAGAGGCLLLAVPPNRQPDVRVAMTGAGLREVPFTLEPEGSRIIHYGD